MLEFGSFFEGDANELYEPKMSDWGHVLFLRSGRDAMRLALSTFDWSKGGILVPTYLCPEVNEVIGEYTNRIYRYNLKRDFSFNIDEIIDLLSTGKYQTILLQDLFNLKVSSQIKNRLLEVFHELIIIHDCTHAIPSYLASNTCPNIREFLLGSVRKWGLNYGGGIIWSKDKWKALDLLPDLKFEQMKKEASSLKQAYLSGNKSVDKNSFRQLYKISEDLLNDGHICSLSQEGIDTVLRSFTHEKLQIRRRNISLFKELMNNSLPLINTDFSSYFMAVIVCNDRNFVQNQCANLGLYTQVIWPLDYLSDEYSEIKEFSENLLCIPIDHRYMEEDISSIVNILMKILD